MLFSYWWSARWLRNAAAAVTVSSNKTTSSFPHVDFPLFYLLDHIALFHCLLPAVKISQCSLSPTLSLPIKEAYVTFWLLHCPSLTSQRSLHQPHQVSMPPTEMLSMFIYEKQLLCPASILGRLLLFKQSLKLHLSLYFHCMFLSHLSCLPPLKS